MTEDAWAGYDFDPLESLEQRAQKAIEDAKTWPYVPVPVELVEGLLQTLKAADKAGMKLGAELNAALEREKRLQVVLSQVEMDQSIMSDEWAKKYADANNLLSAAQVQIQRLQETLRLKELKDAEGPDPEPEI